VCVRAQRYHIVVVYRGPETVAARAVLFVDGSPDPHRCNRETRVADNAINVSAAQETSLSSGDD